ncbi:alpha/beta fold hydrolase [Streptomyces sp. NPDC052396]|uniref:alpha/beta fold hydrolase n=1 Tax=Streptomyces sp. NPDC052396 TaxID=3365689 RepID=UPI0037D7FF70
MPFVQTADGTRLAYEDYGSGTPLVFVAGWALHADMWEYQVPFFVEQGYRCVLLDRRGHGRSERASAGYDMDTLGDDLAALLEQLDLREAVLIAHSFGGHEVAHCLSRHGEERVARIVLVASTLPSLRRGPANPDGLPAAAGAAVLDAQRRDRVKWLVDNAAPYFAAHLGNEVAPAYVEETIRQILSTSPMASLEVTRTNFGAAHEEELSKLGVPALVVHGDADMSAPVEFTGRRTARLIPGCRYMEYQGAAHGLYFTHRDRLNADILGFLAG